MPFALISHTADYAAKITAKTREELFLEAAFALVSFITDPGLLSGGAPVAIEAQGDDLADLMVNWLREVLAYFTVDGLFIYGVVLESLTDTSVKAVANAVSFDPGLHPVYKEIKAVTWHAAFAGPSEGGWEARVVLDV